MSASFFEKKLQPNHLELNKYNLIKKAAVLNVEFRTDPADACIPEIEKAELVRIEESNATTKVKLSMSASFFEKKLQPNHLELNKYNLIKKAAVLNVEFRTDPADACIPGKLNPNDQEAAWTPSSVLK
ncbi:hypothetical protein FQA39_LY11519 [Lamprigera yunnana]|nr:hypothetical protein FQA39_LY11519 [Lamprigera yunnana]